jgi:NAD(P)-dependent dehydrogenase (short-subunit alcohol dehydrogenase family)
MSIEQKVAVITGASRGIERGVGSRLQEHEYRVVATSRSIKPGNDALRGASDDQPARWKAGQSKLRPHVAGLGVTNVSSNRQDE